MYDISGAKENWIEDVRNDLNHLSSLGIFSRKNYIHHGDRPALGVWGLGVGGRVTDANALSKMLQGLRNGTLSGQRFAVVGGTANRFRTLARESPDADKWSKVFASLDVISPWYVGSVRSAADVPRFIERQVQPDKTWADERHIVFMPVIFPGFSRKNLSNGKWPENQIPRECGSLYNAQAKAVLEIGSKTVYTAMFDEVDEATAIFKTIPSRRDEPRQAESVTLDEDNCSLKSDFYLSIAAGIGPQLKFNVTSKR